MEPSNKKERKKAFSNYLVFFIITNTLIVSVVLFAIQIPKIQNRYMEQENINNQAKKKLLKDFHDQTDTLLKLFNSSTSIEVAILKDGEIESALKKMQSIKIGLDTLFDKSTYEYFIYKDLIGISSKCYQSRKTLRQFQKHE